MELTIGEAIAIGTALISVANVIISNKNTSKNVKENVISFKKEVKKEVGKFKDDVKEDITEFKEAVNENLIGFKKDVKEDLDRIETKQDKYNNLQERMVKAEESSKSAHNRMDDSSADRYHFNEQVNSKLDSILKSVTDHVEKFHTRKD